MNENAFSYTYSAACNQEVLNIRSKYLTREESKLEQLKRLDRTVHNSGITAALTLGILGCLVFGTGLCFCLGVLGSSFWPGIPLALAGTLGMLSAYPVHRNLFARAKDKYAPQILALADSIRLENQYK